MNFYLQQGHGMMSLNLEFAQKRTGTGVILSPRNCTRQQIERHAGELRTTNTPIFFDPQFYEPRTERENIINYPYWGNIDFSTANFSGSGAEKLCEGIVRYQIETLDTTGVILPGRYTNSVSEDWLELHYNIAHTAAKLAYEKPLYATIALGPDIINAPEALNRVLNEVIQYSVDGFYIVLSKPNGEYLISNELYIYSLLDAFLSITLANKKIILGYANQQSLIFGSVGVTGLASGNFRNVRSFDPMLFGEQESDGVIQRAIWYYDANTLSEYRSGALGLAYQRGLKGKFGPVCEYCRPLLESSNPVSVRWGEPAAFRHYLWEVNRQCSEIAAVQPSRRIGYTIEVFEKAKVQLNDLIRSGLRPGERSFINVFEPTLNALIALQHDRKEDIKELDNIINFN